MKFCLSTMADIAMDEGGEWPFPIHYLNNTAPVAKQYGMGLELAEFCLSDNLDGGFAQTDQNIREKIPGFDTLVLHGPYNELYPSAIDVKAVELAHYRYDQAYRAAVSYGATKMVIHSGFVPRMYYPSWFTERSVAFWKQFLREHPGKLVICLENVMESDPGLLPAVAAGVDDERLRLTLDIGHAHLWHEHPLTDWLEQGAPYLSHFHIHNNEGTYDTHDMPGKGQIDMARFLHRAEELCPESSVTVECMETEQSARWLQENGFLEA